MSREQFHTAHHRKRVEAVNSFLIWRTAEAVDWDCTMQDLADETGLSLRTVQAVCQRKGWSKRLTANRTGHPDRFPVDVAMRSGEAYA